MNALLVIAHGSRREASNIEVFELTKRLEEKVNARYQIVSAGFLEMAEPDISASIKSCIDDGAKEIDVLPFFLSAGRHVVNDIPEELAAVTDNFPDVKVNVLPYVGGVDMMLDLMVGICLQDEA